MLLLDGYEPPAWLAEAAGRGRRAGAHGARAGPRDGRGRAALEPRGRRGRATRCRCSSPTTGPEYAELAGLNGLRRRRDRERGAAAAPGGAASPPARATSGTPPRRCTPGRSCAGCCPAVAAEVGVREAPVAVGVSRGALAMLHAQHRHPGAFAGLSPAVGQLLGAASSTPRSAGFSRWVRVTAFVARGARGRASARAPRRPCSPAAPGRRTSTTTARWPPPSARSCTSWGDLHNYTARRAALPPHLTGLLAELLVNARHAELYSPAIGAPGNVVAYGHWGRPFLAFPAERGNAWEYASAA